jgi:hypothetical protein
MNGYDIVGIICFLVDHGGAGPYLKIGDRRPPTFGLSSIEGACLKWWLRASLRNQVIFTCYKNKKEFCKSTQASNWVDLDSSFKKNK